MGLHKMTKEQIDELQRQHDFLKENESYVKDEVYRIVKEIGEESDNPDFKKWASNFNKEESDFVVSMEYIVEVQTEADIPKYIQSCVQKIIDRWYW